MSSPRPLYFTVVFWGNEHREYFLRLLAPSLLAHGNLPSLENASDSRFLICTTAEDWGAIQGDPDFLALQRTITPVLIEIPRPNPRDNKYLVMSAGHKFATERVFKDRACGVFLTPDLVLADGGVVALQRLSRKGKRLVLCAAMRYTYEGAVPEIEALRKEHGDPLVLPPRRLAGIALRHMHLETLRYDWDTPYFAEMPHSCFWRVPDEEGIVIHSFNWAPVLADYSKLAEHCTDTFDHSTLDADYIYKNFGDDPAIHVVRDSDELLVISFTKRNDRPGYLSEDALRPCWYKSFPLIGYYWKLARLRWLARSGAVDPLRLRIFRLGVRMHGGNMTEGRWENTERRAAAVTSGAHGRPTVLEWVCVRLVRLIQRSTIWPFSILNRVKPFASGVLALDREVANQSGVGSYRVFLLGPPVSSGKWYWEVFSENLGTVGGRIAATATVGAVQENHSSARELGSGRKGWGWRGDGMRVHAGRFSPHGKAADRSDEVIMVALDMDAGEIWFGRNGAWFEAGNPAVGANPAFAGLTGSLFPAISSMHGGAGAAIMYSHVTAESWAFAPPTGFRPLTDLECLPADARLTNQVIDQAV